MRTEQEREEYWRSWALNNHDLGSLQDRAAGFRPLPPTTSPPEPPTQYALDRPLGTIPPWP